MNEIYLTDVSGIRPNPKDKRRSRTLSLTAELTINLNYINTTSTYRQNNNKQTRSKDNYSKTC